MILIARCSPRAGGASDAMADLLAARLAGKGVEAESATLRGLRYGDCVACKGCKREGSECCVLRDELGPVLESIRAAEALVIASPIYWGDVSALAKALIDRCWSFYLPESWKLEWRSRFASPKRLGFLLPQGNGDPALYGDVAPRYSEVMRDLGFEVSPSLSVRGIGVSERGDLLGRPEIAAAVEAMAEELASRSS